MAAEEERRSTRAAVESPHGQAWRSCWAA